MDLFKVLGNIVISIVESVSEKSIDIIEKNPEKAAEKGITVEQYKKKLQECEKVREYINNKQR